MFNSTFLQTKNNNMNNSTTTTFKKFFLSAALSFICLAGLLLNSAVAQTVIISPTANGSFESTFSADGWITNFGATPANNIFAIGNAATIGFTPTNGTKGVFVTNNGTSRGYVHTSAITWIYKDVTLPAGQSIATMTMDLFGYTNDAGYDGIVVGITDQTYLASLTTGATGALAATSITGMTLATTATTNTFMEDGNYTAATTRTFTFPSAALGNSVSSSLRRIWIGFRCDGSVGNITTPYSFDKVNMVTVAPANFSAVQGGLWNSLATWSGGVVPAAGNNITIPAGMIVTVDQAISYNNLTIDGTLQWGSTSFAMTLSGNLLINSGGKFLPYTTGGTGQSLTVGGNFQNDGYTNLALLSTALTFNGGTGSTLSGTGTFQGDGSKGIIRSLFFSSLGGGTVSTSQNLIVTNTLAHAAGNLNTNGKLTLDNTAQIYGLPINNQVASVAVTAMGTTTYSVNPVVFGVATTQWSNITGVLNTVYVSGNNVYRCSAAANIGPSAPTHTTGIAQNLLWIGTVGTIGTPFLGVAPHTAGTQYFYGNRLYTCTTTGSPALGYFPTHTTGTVTSGTTTFLYVGSPATVTNNFNAGNGTVRSLTLTSAGSGYSQSAPSIAFSIGATGASGSGAAAVAVLLQQVAGPASQSLQKGGGAATISGGLTINSDQGTSLATANSQASSGVGAITTSNGGVNYTVAPTVGFAGPTALNLITNPGSGYTALPTITVTGGTLVSGAALTTANFTITVNSGVVESVYLNALTTATYSVPPTLSLTASPGVTATLEFPSNCWPAATASIGANGQLSNFTITNAGFGYVVAPTVGVGTVSGTATGGTFTTVATAPTARVGLYNLVLSFYAPATAPVVNGDDAAIPANRKLNTLSLSGNGLGLNLNTSGLTIYGSTTPLALSASGNGAGNVLNLGGNNLNFTWRDYGGISSTFGINSAYIKNGSMSLTFRGGSTGTMNFPFSGTFGWVSGSTPTAVTTGCSVTRITVSETAAPTNGASGTAYVVGNRAYRVQLGSGVLGLNPTVSLGFNSQDGLTVTQNNLFVAESTNLTGEWTTRSTAYGVSGALPATGSKATAITAPGPIVPTSDSYYAWAWSSPIISNFGPLTVCANAGTFTITGTGLTGVSNLKIGGVPVASFTIVSDASITGIAGAATTGVVTFDKFGATFTGTQTITVIASPSAPTAAGTTVLFSNSATITPSSVGGVLNYYTAASGGTLLYTGPSYTFLACGNTSTVYVEENDGTCSGPRSAVIVTVQTPQIVASDDVFCGVGGPLDLSVEPLPLNASIVWASLTPGVSLSDTTANPTSTTILSTSDFKLTVSTQGVCADYILYKSIGVYPLPTSTVTTTASGVCPGTSATINSGLSAGTFTSASIPYAALVAPATAATLVTGGVATPAVTGTLDDGGWGNIPIGFNFNFFGTPYSTINVGTNGTLMFGPLNTNGGFTTPYGLADFSFASLPSTSEPFNMIAVLAMDNDLAGATGGTIRYWTSGYAPNRKFVVSYQGVKEYFDTKYSTAQAIFYETTGVVEVHVFSSTNIDRNKLVGINSGDGLIGSLAYASGTTPSATNPIVTPFAYRFSPPSNYSTYWTAGGSLLASGTNIFTQVVAPTTTTLYEIQYTDITTGCASESSDATRVNMLVLSNAPITGVLTTSSQSSVCAGSTVSLSHNYTGTSSALTYQWQVSIDGGTTWLDVVGATNATFSQIQNAPTSYRVGIRSCLGAISYASPLAIPMSDFSLCYCTPVSSGGSGTLINNVSLSAFTNFTNNSSASNPSASPYYTNYIALPNTPLVGQGSVMNLSLTLSALGTYSASIVSVWIDYNHNGIFEASEWTQFGTSVPSGQTTTVGITIPQTALSGNTVMRIRTRGTGNTNWSTDACTYFGSGETEDYMINILALPAPPATPLVANDVTSCYLGATISMAGTAPQGVAYYWQTSATGTSLDNSDSTWTVFSSGTYYIRAYGAQYGQWSAATPILVNTFPTITPPTPITTLLGSPYCNSSALQVGISPAGVAYYWQGTNPLGTVNTNPTTTNLIATSSGTYYVAAFDSLSGCWSMPTSIPVVIYPAPTGTVVGTSSASCESTVGSVAFNVSGAGNVFLSDFSSSTLPAGATLAGNDAAITANGRLRLTSAANSKNGGLLIQNVIGVSSNDYQIDFDFQTTSGSFTPADGLSYSYGPDVVALPTGLGSESVGSTVDPGTTNPENGSGSGLKLAFDAYANGVAPSLNAPGVYLMYNCPIWNQIPTSSGVILYSNDVTWRSTTSTNPTTHVTIKVDSTGRLNMWLNGILSVANHQLPASYTTANKSTWKHAFSARTGASYQGHFIDNVDIHYNNIYEYSLTDTTWTTENPISAALGTYNASVRYAGVGGCVVPLGQVTVGEFSMSQVAISAPDALACPGEVMTINAVVSGMSNNLTYQWQRSIDNGVTWADIAGATSLSVSAAQTVASLYRLGVFYCADTIASYTSPFSIAMDYIPAPTITVSSPQSTVCYGTPVTFTANVANEGTPPSACNYTFKMFDRFGDGWDGAEMKVMNGTTVVATLSGPLPGSSPNSTGIVNPNADTLAQTVLLQSGLSYTFQWTTAGSWPAEVGVSVVDPSGTTIYNMPYLSSTLSGDTLTTITPNCSSSQIAWQVNGVAVSGANALTYTTSSLINTDVVTASVKVLLPCLSQTVVSPPAALVVAPALIPTVTVVSSASTVCQGTSVTFTASGSPSNVGGPGTSCNYTFNMFDSYGDGWNGNQMRVMNGTTVVATLTGPAAEFSGANSLAQTVSLQSGISYSLVWNTAGGFPEEVGLSVVNASGVTVYSMDFDNDILAGTTLTTISADCPVPSTYQWRINGSPIAGVTGATYTSSALSPTDVLTVSYSTNAPCYSTVPVVDTAALVVVANTVVTTSVTAIYSYTWANNDSTYTSSGLYSRSVTNCVTQKLNLTILQPTVTFQVDMAQSNAPAGAIPYVNGLYSMTNIGGSIWSATVPLPGNTVYEYKFTYNVLAGSENLAGSSCVVTSNGNRSVSVGTTNMVLPLVCWNSCSTCPGGLTLKVFLDGYYKNLSSPASMRAARYKNLVELGSANPGAAKDVDFITVQLRGTTPGSGQPILHTATPMLDTNGRAFCVFPESAIGGSYYVVVDHRASMPLWSQNPITLSTSSTLNFANTLASAYSDPGNDALLTPMKTISSGLYGVWMGELDETGFLDAFDYSNLEGDIYQSQYSGQYLLDGDLNGDAYVDASDYAVYDVNSILGLYEQRPY